MEEKGRGKKNASDKKKTHQNALHPKKIKNEVIVSCRAATCMHAAGSTVLSWKCTHFVPPALLPCCQQQLPAMACNQEPVGWVLDHVIFYDC